MSTQRSPLTRIQICALWSAGLESQLGLAAHGVSYAVARALISKGLVMRLGVYRGTVLISPTKVGWEVIAALALGPWVQGLTPHVAGH